MVVIHSYLIAVIMCVVTMLCWGSWGNTQKLASRQWNFQLFYWDYGFGVLICALVLAFTMGSIGEEGRSFLKDLAQFNSPDTAVAVGFKHNALIAFIGGVLFNLSNLLLVIATDIAGLAVAFPIGVGLALVLGVATTYCLRPEGNPGLLAVGVTLIVIAIIVNAIAYYKKQQAGDKKQQASGKGGILISVIAGVLMGCGFFALVARGMVKDFVNPEAGMMTPYTALVIFSLGLVISNFLWNSIIMAKPLKGEPVPFGDYFTKGSLRLHAVGMLGGIIWNIGMSFSLIASGVAGAALSYALGQGAPMVAALWGVFIWKEFKGAPKGTGWYLFTMFVFFLAGLGVLIASK